MRRRRRYRQFGTIQQRLFWVTALLLVWVLCSGAAYAAPSGALSDRIAQFPQWQNKPTVTLLKPNAGDLEYPDWMAGTWTVESTLVDLYAPLAPAIVTPGFEGNRQYLDQPLSFDVRFGPASPAANTPKTPFPFTGSSLVRSQLATGGPKEPIVADRAFNGLNLARAYLGKEAVYQVTMDPANPNRQITELQGRAQLLSTVTGRATEIPNSNQFIATEVVQQIFQGVPQPYLNEVESTTVYRKLVDEDAEGGGAEGSGTELSSAESGDSESDTDSPVIKADQFTAIYLSPQDPDYFRAKDKPVALYRYRLEFRS